MNTVDAVRELRRICEMLREMHRRQVFDWHKPAFTREKAHMAAVYALLAYVPIPELELKRSVRIKIVPCDLYARLLAAGQPVDLRALLRQIGAEDFDVFVVSNRGAVAVGVRARDAIFLAIRGTATLADMLIDLRTWTLRPYHGTPLKFHRGFYTTISSLRWKIITELERWGLDRPLVITGHSLGGAMAGILNSLNEFRGYWLNLAVPHVSSCYTFGMPRYANAEALQDRPYPFHVYDTRDPFPRVPPTLFGYAQTSNPEYAVQKALVPAARAMAPVLAARVVHHRIETYLASLNGITGLLAV